MSDETDVREQMAGVPVPVTPSRRGRVIAVVALVSVILLGGCGLAAWAGATLFDRIDESIHLDEDDWRFSPEYATLSDDGRYAVISTYNGDELPMSVVVDIESGVSREEHGTLCVTSEVAPVAWLVPFTPDEWESRIYSGAALPAFDLYDEPPSALEAWEFAEEASRPSDGAPSRWRAVDGGGGWLAYLEVDVLRGGHPSRMLLNNSASSGEGHRADLPQDFGTFSFCGFPDSGAYVAVEELTPTSDAPDDTYGQLHYGDDLPHRRLVIVRADDGEAVAEATLGFDTLGHSSAWDSSSEYMVWAETEYDDMSGDVVEIRLRGMGPDGEIADMFDVWGIPRPTHWQDYREITIAGTDDATSELVVVADDRILALGPGGAVDRGTLAWAESPPVYHEGRGLLQLETEWQDYRRRTLAVLYDSHGGSRKIVWTGPWRAGGAEWE